MALKGCFQYCHPLYLKHSQRKPLHNGRHTRDWIEVETTKAHSLVAQYVVTDIIQPVTKVVRNVPPNYLLAKNP